ncbi:MAG: tRNA uridine-5-carboxymethylaminomethyl(34) synthesis GTPase MnmE [Bacilli bacterium]|nr:tRNA uridine-5-carboxymethylaminomethyl(34) synthesis GTPase MnmE [Bacilli bacterium]
MAKPIIALATPPMKGALALIRTSGDGVFDIIDSLMPKAEIGKRRERGIYYGALKDDGKLIDLCVVFVYPAEVSPTGEDVVEISCHGSMLIVEEIVQAFLSRGAEYATRGEFSSRSFYNGKMDLVEAESVNDLINATTAEAKNLALLSLSGKTSKLVAPLKQEISEILALVEVNIDYPEYTDIEEATNDKIVDSCAKIRGSVAALIKEGREGQIIREGVKVALVGEPNVGKSSLLNALLSQDKAIVSDIPGTTRDVVEGDLAIRGIAIKLLDTAGVRDTEDVVEKLGVERSNKSIDEADLVIVILDASKDETSNPLLDLTKNKKRIIVYNKADLVSSKDDGKLYVSALENDIEPLKEAIFNSLSVSDSAYVTPSFSNARELALLKDIEANLRQAEEDAKMDLGADLISVSLQTAYNDARKLIGEDPTQDLTDEIFSRFCVGK